MSNLLAREYEINFSHVDNRGFARPSFLFDAMQDAATVHADTLHLGRQDIPVLWVLSRIRLTISRPLLPYERVRCETWCAGTRGASWIRSFAFVARDGQVGQAQSMWVMLDPNSHHILRPTAFGPIDGYLLDPASEPPASLPKLSCDTVRPHHSHTVCYSDLDVNNHLNNVRVVELVCDALDLQKQPGFISSLQVNYTAETTLGQDVLLSCGTADGARYIEGSVDGQTHFEAAAVLSPLPSSRKEAKTLD